MGEHIRPSRRASQNPRILFSFVSNQFVLRTRPILTTFLPPLQLKSFISDDPSTWFGWSIHLAAGCETASMFDAVLATLDHELDPEKVVSTPASRERVYVALSWLHRWINGRACRPWESGSCG